MNCSGLLLLLMGEGTVCNCGVIGQIAAHCCQCWEWQPSCRITRREHWCRLAPSDSVTRLVRWIWWVESRGAAGYSQLQPVTAGSCPSPHYWQLSLPTSQIVSYASLHSCQLPDTWIFMHFCTACDCMSAGIPFFIHFKWVVSVKVSLSKITFETGVKL